MDIQELKAIIEEGLFNDICAGDEMVVDHVIDLKYSDYLTSDDGLVVKYLDGKKFIITVQEV